jgi:hypothetical protein
MNALALQKCLNHPAREAAARCLDCAGNFCRECVVEHDGRLVCAACLRKATKPSVFREVWLKKAWSFLQTAAALIFLWMAFFTFGKILLAIPSSFHEGELWKQIGEKL